MAPLASDMPPPLWLPATNDNDDHNPALRHVLSAAGGAADADAADMLEELEGVVACLQEEMQEIREDVQDYHRRSSGLYSVKLRVLGQRQELLDLSLTTRSQDVQKEARELLQEVGQEVACLDAEMAKLTDLMQAATRRAQRLHDALAAIERRRLDYDAGFINWRALEAHVIELVLELQD